MSVLHFPLRVSCSIISLLHFWDHASIFFAPAWFWSSRSSQSFFIFSRCILTFFFTTTRCHADKNLTTQNSTNAMTILRNTYSPDPWLI
jgi:hypothetical protein